MNTANSRTSGLPTALRLAGKSLRISYSFAAPPLLSPQPRLLRSTRDRAGRIDSRYWKLARSGRYRFAAVDTGTFDLDAARAEVTCHLLPGFSGGEVEEILRGPVCAFFLLERGFEPLHASGVSLDGRCIAFAGNPGAGKSSLVAWMSRHGAQFVCDDILPLRESRGAVRAHPGLAQIRLEPPAAEKLGWKNRPELSNPRGELREKKKFRVATARRPCPVAGIYLLERQKKGAARGVEVRRLDPRAAFRALLKSTRNDSLATPGRLRRQMRLFAKLARTVPVCRLQYPSGFAAFPAVLKRLRQDLV